MQGVVDIDSQTRSVALDHLGTDHAAVCTSVGRVIGDLWEKYLLPPTEQNKAENTRRGLAFLQDFDRAVEQLIPDKENVKRIKIALFGLKDEHDEPVKVGKFEEPLDEFDRVTYTDASGTHIDRKIPLLEIFALVAKALMDSDSLDKGKTEEARTRDRNDRILMLYNALCSLVDGADICHQGWRNALILPLVGVLPNVQIVEDEVSFLVDKLGESIAAEIRPPFEPQKKFEVYKAWAMHAQAAAGKPTPWTQFCDDPTKDATGRTRKERIREYVTRQFTENGIDVSSTQSTLRNLQAYLDALAELSPVVDQAIDPLSYCFPDVLALKLDEDADRTAAINRARKTLEEAHSFDELRAKRVDQFLAVERLCQDARHLDKIAFATEFQGPIQELQQRVHRYYQSLPTGTLAVGAELPPRLPEDFLATDGAQLSSIRKALMEKLGGSEWFAFIENFFAHWFSGGVAQRSKFFAKVSDPVCLAKISYSTAALQELVARNLKVENEAQVLELSPYEINRVLLQALLTSPHDWNPAFAQVLDVILQFFDRNQLRLVGIEGILIKTSYPPELQQELKALVHVYHAEKGDQDSFPPEEFLKTPFPVTPTLTGVPNPVWRQLGQSIQTFDQLKNLAGLPESARGEVITVVARNHDALVAIAKSITTLEQLKKLGSLPRSIRDALIPILENTVELDKITQSITFEQLSELEDLPRQIRVIAINKIVQSITPEQLRVFRAFDGGIQAALRTAILGNTAKLVEIAQSITFEQLVRLLPSYVLPGQIRNALTTAILGSARLSEIAQSITFEQLMELTILPDQVQDALTTAILGSARFNEIAQSLTSEQLMKFKSLPASIQEPLTAAMLKNTTRLAEIAQSLSYKQLRQLLPLDTLPDQVRDALTTAVLGSARFNEIVQSITFEQLRLEELAGLPKSIQIIAINKIASSITFEQLEKITRSPPAYYEQLLTAAILKNTTRLAEIAQSITFEQLMKLNILPTQIRDALTTAILGSARLTTIVASITLFRLSMLVEKKDLPTPVRKALVDKIAQSITFEQLKELGKSEDLSEFARETLTTAILGSTRLTDIVQSITFEQLKELVELYNLPESIVKVLVRQITQSITSEQLNELVEDEDLPDATREALIKAIAQNTAGEKPLIEGGVTSSAGTDVISSVAPPPAAAASVASGAVPPRPASATPAAPIPTAIHALGRPDETHSRRLPAEGGATSSAGVVEPIQAKAVRSQKSRKWGSGVMWAGIACAIAAAFSFPILFLSLPLIAVGGIGIGVGLWKRRQEKKEAAAEMRAKAVMPVPPPQQPLSPLGALPPSTVVVVEGLDQYPPSPRASGDHSPVIQRPSNSGLPAIKNPSEVSGAEVRATDQPAVVDDLPHRLQGG